MKNSGITLAIIALLLSTPALAKEGYYRWLDDSGRPNFTQKPPADRPSQFIETGRGFSSSADNQEPADSSPATAGDQAKTDPAQPKDQQYEVLPEKDNGRCQQAKSALESMSRGQRVRVKDEKTGEYRILDDKEQEEQKNKAKELVGVYC